MVFTPTFALLSIVLVPTIVSITIGSSIPRQYLRLSFDGGSRGVNELGSGGAVLHFCYDENISAITVAMNGGGSTCEAIEYPHDVTMNTVSAVYDGDDSGRCSPQNKTDSSYEEIELYRGSYFYGDSVSSHLAEYLALIDGLHAFKCIITSDDPSLLITLNKRNYEEKMRKLGISLDSPTCLLEIKRLDKDASGNYYNVKNGNPNDQIESYNEKKIHEHIHQIKNMILYKTQKLYGNENLDEIIYGNNIGNDVLRIQGDSKIIINNLLKRYPPKNKILRNAHSTATALLDSIKKYDMYHIHREKNQIADKLATLGVLNRKTITTVTVRRTPLTSCSNYDSNYHSISHPVYDLNSQSGFKSMSCSVSVSNYGFNEKKILKYNNNNESVFVSLHSSINCTDNATLLTISTYLSDPKTETETDDNIDSKNNSHPNHENDSHSDSHSDSDSISDKLYLGEKEEITKGEGRREEEKENKLKYEIKDEDRSSEKKGTDEGETEDKKKMEKKNEKNLNIGGLFFTKVCTGEIPPYLRSTYEQFLINIKLDENSISIPINFEYEKKEKKSYIYTKKYLKNVQTRKISKHQVKDKTNLNNKNIEKVDQEETVIEPLVSFDNYKYLVDKKSISLINFRISRDVKVDVKSCTLSKAFKPSTLGNKDTDKDTDKDKGIDTDKDKDIHTDKYRDIDKDKDRDKQKDTDGDKDKDIETDNTSCNNDYNIYETSLSIVLTNGIISSPGPRIDNLTNITSNTFGDRNIDANISHNDRNSIIDVTGYTSRASNSDTDTSSMNISNAIGCGNSNSNTNSNNENKDENGKGKVDENKDENGKIEDGELRSNKKRFQRRCEIDEKEKKAVIKLEVNDEDGDEYDVILNDDNEGIRLHSESYKSQTDKSKVWHFSQSLFLPRLLPFSSLQGTFHEDDENNFSEERTSLKRDWNKKNELKIKVKISYFPFFQTLPPDNVIPQGSPLSVESSIFSSSSCQALQQFLTRDCSETDESDDVDYMVNQALFLLIYFLLYLFYTSSFTFILFLFLFTLFYHMLYIFSFLF